MAGVALTLLLASSAHATNFCVSFGGAQIVASGLILPAKGACSAFNGFFANKAGLLLAGDVCRSSNGTTFLFNTFTQFNALPDTLAGTWAASSGAGSGNECSSARCLSFNVAVTKCPNNVKVPADLSGSEAEVFSPALTTGEPRSE
jgi:hypothetical protein